MMKHLKIVLVLLLFFTALGCLEQADTKPKPQEYAFEYTPYNSTAYYIEGDVVKTVHVVHNTTRLEVLLQSSASISPKHNFGLSNIVVVNKSNTAQPYQYRVSSQVRGGMNHVFIEFPPYADFVAYTEEIKGNDLTRRIVDDSRIKVVLSQDYTTGNLFLGIPRPSPDRRYEDASGRLVLEWQRPVMGGFSVKYYRKSAPVVLSIFFTILAAAGMIALTYFGLKIKALRKIREGIEKKP
jgi:hypothetical protein